MWSRKQARHVVREPPCLFSVHDLIAFCNDFFLKTKVIYGLPTSCCIFTCWAITFTHTFCQLAIAVFFEHGLLFHPLRMHTKQKTWLLQKKLWKFWFQHCGVVWHTGKSSRLRCSRSPVQTPAGPGVDFVGPILFCIRMAHYSSGEAGWFSARTLSFHKYS